MKFLILAAALLAADTPPSTDSLPETSAAAIEAAPKGAVIVADDVQIIAAQLDAGDTVIVTDAFRDLVQIITNWRAVGSLAAVALLLGLLLRLTKLGALYRFFDSKGIAWARPVFAAVLGGAGAVVTAIAGGVKDIPGLLVAFASGAFAGFSAVGGYSTLRLASPVERDKKRVTSASLDVLNAAAEENLVAATVAASAATGPVRAAVAASENLPAHKRAEALAVLLNKAPVSP